MGMPSTFAMMTVLMNPSKAFERTSLYRQWRIEFSGGRIPWAGVLLAKAFIVATHCFCSRVIVAEPSCSRCIRVKLSTTTPTKRLIAKMYPTNIHDRAKAAIGEKSSRPGATPGSATPIIVNIGSCHWSAELMT
eukprot:5530066-Prymnesium_polylepis.3